MKQSSELASTLKEIVVWNKARLNCFTKMLLALFSVRTVNLRELAVAFGSDTLLDSSYKRLKRFFSNLKVDTGIIAPWIFKLFFPETKKVYLIIDRTNWYWGQQKITIFMLGIAYEGLAIPLYWRLLPKAGNSNFTDKKSLLNRFLLVIGFCWAHKVGEWRAIKKPIPFNHYLITIVKAEDLNILFFVTALIVFEKRYLIHCVN